MTIDLRIYEGSQKDCAPCSCRCSSSAKAWFYLCINPQDLEHRPQGLVNRPQGLVHRPQGLVHQPVFSSSGDGGSSSSSSSSTAAAAEWRRHHHHLAMGEEGEREMATEIKWGAGGGSRVWTSLAERRDKRWCLLQSSCTWFNNWPPGPTVTAHVKAFCNNLLKLSALICPNVRKYFHHLYPSFCQSFWCVHVLSFCLSFVWEIRQSYALQAKLSAAYLDASQLNLPYFLMAPTEWPVEQHSCHLWVQPSAVCLNEFLAFYHML